VEKIAVSLLKKFPEICIMYEGEIRKGKIFILYLLNKKCGLHKIFA